MGRSYRVRTFDYGRDMPDPAVVDAEIFRPIGLAIVREFIEAQQGLLEVAAKNRVNRADSDQELIDLVGKVLQSPQV